MIKVSVMYPNSEGSTFDMDYYLTKHMPMVQQKIGTALRSVSVVGGLSGGAPGSSPTYSVIAILEFDSVQSFETNFGQHSAEILADVPNYTNTLPTVQISEVKL